MSFMIVVIIVVTVSATVIEAIVVVILMVLVLIIDVFLTQVFNFVECKQLVVLGLLVATFLLWSPTTR